MLRHAIPETVDTSFLASCQSAACQQMSSIACSTQQGPHSTLSISCTTRCVVLSTAFSTSGLAVPLSPPLHSAQGLTWDV